MSDGKDEMSNGKDEMNDGKEKNLKQSLTYSKLKEYQNQSIGSAFYTLRQ